MSCVLDFETEKKTYMLLKVGARLAEVLLLELILPRELVRLPRLPLLLIPVEMPNEGPEK